METLGIVFLIYGAFCFLVAATKLPLIWNMKKLVIMEKMMGKVGLQAFILIWGLGFMIAGYILYT